jgi:CheY-like chemotaxis protein
MESALIRDVEIAGEQKTALVPLIDFGSGANRGCTGVLSERRTILLVEDEEFVREVACEVLRSAGYRVLTAKNAREAQKVYDDEAAAIDLLLTDVVMPGETGRSLASRLRAGNPLLRVLLATGYGEQMAVRGDGGEQCLAKPFSSRELLRRVKELVGEPLLAAIS